jgi:hypothetical protein
MRDGGLRVQGEAPARAKEKELVAKTARKDGKQVVTLRAVQRGAECAVECEVYPVSGLRVDPLSPGPYTFGSPDEAKAFVDEAAQALMFLGCEVV